MSILTINEESTMLITIEDRELKKLVKSLVMGVLDNFMEKKLVADREGFEPSVRLPRRTLSRGVVSATHPSVQEKK